MARKACAKRGRNQSGFHAEERGLPPVRQGATDKSPAGRASDVLRAGVSAVEGAGREAAGKLQRWGSVLHAGQSVVPVQNQGAVAEGGEWWRAEPMKNVY